MSSICAGMLVDRGREDAASASVLLCVCVGGGGGVVTVRYTVSDTVRYTVEIMRLHVLVYPIQYRILQSDTQSEYSYRMRIEDCRNRRISTVQYRTRTRYGTAPYTAVSTVPVPYRSALASSSYSTVVQYEYEYE